MIRQLGVLLALAGCAQAAQESPPPATTTTTTTAVVAANVETHDAPRAMAKPPATFTDEQIVAILWTYDEGEIRLAKLARTRSKNTRVVSLATMIRDDYTTAIAREKQLAADLVVQHTTTDKTRALEQATSDEMESLATLSARAFDTEFVSNQVNRERDTLAMLDVQLIPSARVPNVRARLADYRDRVDHHLRDDENLKRALASPPVAGNAATTHQTEP